MASWNTDEFSRAVIPALKARTTLARTIAIDVSSTPGVNGGTYNFRSPYVAGDANVYTAADRAAKNSFIFDDVQDQVTPITLDGFAYKGLALPADYQTFAVWDLKDNINQCAGSVANKVNALTSGLFQTEINAITVTNATVLGANVEESTAIILGKVLTAKTQLDVAGVDTFGRTLAVSPLTAEILLASDKFSSADKSGTPDALREASVGRIYGFDVIVDNGLSGHGFVAYEKYAFGLIVRPKAKSTAAVESTVTMAEDSSFVLSATISYDSALQEDRLVVGAFVGLGKLDPARSVAARFKLPV